MSHSNGLSSRFAFFEGGAATACPPGWNSAPNTTKCMRLLPDPETHAHCEHACAAHGGSLGPAAVALVLAELGRAVVARVAPGGGVAPSSGAVAVVGGLAASRALRASADPRVPLGALAAARVAGCGAAALPAAALASLLAVEADAAAVRSAVVVPAPPPQLVFVVAVFAAALVFLVATFERLLEASTRDASMLVVAAAALAAGSLLPDARSFLRGD